MNVLLTASFFAAVTIGFILGFFIGRFGKKETPSTFRQPESIPSPENRLIESLLKASVRDDGLVAGAIEMTHILKQHFAVQGVSLYLLNERCKPRLVHSTLPAQQGLSGLVNDFIARDTAGEIRTWQDASNSGLLKETKYLFLIRLQAEDKTIGVAAFQNHVGGLLDDAPEDFFQTVSSALARGLWVLCRQEDLRINSLIDPLTGALNKRALLDEGPGLFDRARTAKLPVPIAMFDIDRFKSINDTFGHPFGDIVLRTFSERLREQFRNEDLIFRYGGEEFVLMLPGCPVELAVQRLDAFRTYCIENAIEENGVSTSVTASCGLTLLHDSDTVDSVLQRVDKLLYAAKEAGRQGYVRSDLVSNCD